MTQEEKQLIFKDLCARLPYGVVIEITSDGGMVEVSYDMRLDAGLLVDLLYSEEDDFKPYLRPMSSMTDEEREDWYRQSKVDYDCEFKPEPTLSLEHCHLSVDWLNKYGFDYRGLIPMGLALEAPEGMYMSYSEKHPATEGIIKKEMKASKNMGTFLKRKMNRL